MEDGSIQAVNDPEERRQIQEQSASKKK